MKKYKAKISPKTHGFEPFVHHFDALNKIDAVDFLNQFVSIHDAVFSELEEMENNA